VFTLGNEVILTTAPPERAGAASAISETSAEFSGALGIALLGSLGTWLYRGRLQDALPAGLGEPARAEALATLGGALAMAQALPGPAGPALAEAARAAFVGTLQSVALMATAIVVLAAVISARILRGHQA
jgi:DHA2 family multidrug resistance protein-like MFS transporter